jgi:hypothetical protein
MSVYTLTLLLVRVLQKCNEGFFNSVFFLVGSLSLMEMFPELRTLVLYNIPEMSSDDLEPYVALIPFLQHVILKRCSLKKASSLIRSKLLGHGTNSQLQRCILHSDHRNNGIVFHEPISSLYQVQNSLTYLRIYVEDFISLKNLLEFLPELLTLGMFNKKF